VLLAGGIVALMLAEGIPGLGVPAVHLPEPTAPTAHGLSDPAVSATIAGLGPAAAPASSCARASRACPADATAAPRPAGSGGGWLNLSLSNAPTARYLPAFAYDAHDGYGLVFGGYTGSSVLSDTWAYQNGTWTQLTPSVSPAARYAPYAAYDPAENAVVMFGGYDYTNTTIYGDTWLFQNGSWSPLSLKVHPPAMWRGAMAYDARDGYVVLYGGSTSTTAVGSDGTWKFQNNTWTNITSQITGAPPALCRVTMSYDSADKEIVLFGGWTNGGSVSSETWVYSNSTWTELTPKTSPIGRVYDYQSDDPSAAGTLLFGGDNYATYEPYNDTWKFSNGTWTNVSGTSGSAPSVRAFGAMIYDPVGGYVVLYGGAGSGSTPSTYYADTYTYGLSALVFASATPPTTDVGVRTNISVVVLTTAKNLGFTYTGLPPGCASANQSYDLCRPTAAGTYSVVAYVNSTASKFSVRANTTLLVDPRPVITGLTFTPASVTAGVHTRMSVSAEYGTPYYSYSWPKLPPGCNGYNTSNLSCAPSAGGAFTVTAQVTDAVGGTATYSANLTVADRPARNGFRSVPSELDYGLTALLYANVTGGTAPFSYSWANLPVPCASLNESPLPCKPAELATIEISVTVSDRFGVAVTGTINLTVNPDMRLESNGISATAVDAGTRFTLYMNVTGGTTPYNYTFANAPPGCRLPDSDIATCAATGNGTFGIVESVTDGSGASLSVTDTIVVAADPVLVGITVGPPPSIDLGQAIHLSVTISGGTLPFAFTYTGLPAGCTGISQPSFSCTPTQSGHFPFTVTAKDLLDRSVSGTGTIGVAPTLRIGGFTATPASVTTGNPVVLDVSVVGGTGTSPYTYAYRNLPAGCTGSDAASLSCTPTSTGTFRVTVTVTDAVQGVSAASATLNVSAPPSSGGLSGAADDGIVGGVIVGIAVVALAIGLRRRRGGKARPPAARPKRPSRPAEPAPEELYGAPPPSG
jgi:hypothetical protein